LMDQRDNFQVRKIAGVKIIVLLAAFTALLLSETVFPASNSWILKSRFIRYDVEPSVRFVNGTVIPFEGFLYLRCVSVSGGRAEFLAVLGSYTGTISLRTKVSIDFSSRMVFDEENRCLGLTYLFMPERPPVNERFKLYSLGSTAGFAVVGKVVAYRMPRYGFQRCVIVYPEDTGIPLVYEEDTGILVLGTLVSYDAVLYSLGVAEVFSLELESTNVDLGPSDVIAETISFIMNPYVLFTVAVASSTAAFIYLRLRRLREHAKQVSG